MNAKDHIGRIKQMPCALCGASGPSDAHHIREGMGMAQRNSDWLAIPLCKDCHQGPHNGIHGKRMLWNVMKKTELDLLAETFKSMLCGNAQ